MELVIFHETSWLSTDRQDIQPFNEAYLLSQIYILKLCTSIAVPGLLIGKPLPSQKLFSLQA